MHNTLEKPVAITTFHRNKLTIPGRNKALVVKIFMKTLIETARRGQGVRLLKYKSL